MCFCFQHRHDSSSSGLQQRDGRNSYIRDALCGLWGVESMIHPQVVANSWLEGRDSHASASAGFPCAVWGDTGKTRAGGASIVACEAEHMSLNQGWNPTCSDGGTAVLLAPTQCRGLRLPRANGCCGCSEDVVQHIHSPRRTAGSGSGGNQQSTSFHETQP